MSNTPLPAPACIVTTLGSHRPQHFMLSTSRGVALMERHIGSTLHLFADDQMHAHAAAVSAAKDAEIAQLRADNIRLQNEVVMPLRERVRVLEDALTKIDAIRNDIIGRQKIGWSQHVYPLVAALDEAGYPGMEYEAARAALGDNVPTTPPSSPSPRS